MARLLRPRSISGGVNGVRGSRSCSLGVPGSSIGRPSSRADGVAAKSGDGEGIFHVTGGKSWEGEKGARLIYNIRGSII